MSSEPSKNTNTVELIDGPWDGMRLPDMGDRPWVRVMCQGKGGPLIESRYERVSWERFHWCETVEISPPIDTPWPNERTLHERPDTSSL